MDDVPRVLSTTTYSYPLELPPLKTERDHVLRVGARAMENQPLYVFLVCTCAEWRRGPSGEHWRFCKHTYAAWINHDPIVMQEARRLIIDTYARMADITYTAIFWQGIVYGTSLDESLADVFYIFRLDYPIPKKPKVRPERTWLDYLEL